MTRILSCFAVACLMTAGSALAGSTSVRVEGNPPGNFQLLAANVQYGDLDISTPAGAKALLDRIDAAALQVCGARNGKRSAFVRADQFEACTKSAVHDAVKSVEAPELAKVAAAR